jgi:SAM-dependent methyltransferase
MLTDETAKRRGCPACQSQSFRSYGLKSEFELLVCRECGTIYASTVPASTAEAYDDYYTEENLSIPDFIDKRLDEIVAGFARYRRLNRLLEVGFGTASLLRAAARAEWQVEGVEVSRTAIEQARAGGFKTFLGELAAAHYEAASFDVVVASELLEHVPEPSTLIREMARILRPGGLFWATTPNAKGLSARVLGSEWTVICPPEHLHLFSEAGIRRLLAAASFRKIRIRTEGVNPYELLHSLRAVKPGDDHAVPAGGCERVNAGYRLNKTLVSNTPGWVVKNLVNGLLRLSHLGDSLKIMAER